MYVVASNENGRTLYFRYIDRTVGLPSGHSYTYDVKKAAVVFAEDEAQNLLDIAQEDYYVGDLPAEPTIRVVVGPVNL